MTAPQDRTISIKLDIQIPIGAAVGEPVIQTSKATVPAIPVGVFGGGIEEPCGNVPGYWDGTTATVVGHGTIQDGLVKPSRVVGEVFAGSTAGDPDGSATTFHVNPDTGYWQQTFTVPGYPSNGPYTLGLWVFWDGYYQPTKMSSIFYPIWYPYPPPSPGPVLTAMAWDLMPVCWAISPSAFAGGPLAHFNGHWRLQPIITATAGLAFCNGGDGVCTPRIQLRCDSPKAADWRLVFELGSCVVSYTCPATQFQTQHQNIFRHPAIELSDDSLGVPVMVAIVPA